MDVEDDSAFEYDDDEEYPVGEEDWGDEAAGGEDGGGDGGAAGGAAAGGAGDSGGGAAAAAPPAPAGHPAFVKQTSYVTTDVAGMAATMQGRINHCAALFDVTIDEAIVLLMVYSWREDRLQEAWVEDPGRVRRRAGVTAGPDPPALPVEAATTPAFEDPVSFDTCAWADTDALPCGHRASKAVWHDAVAAAIRDPNAALLARCIAAGDGCVEVIRPRMFRSYLPPTDAAKYDAALLRSFAATNPHIRFCPGAGCDQVIIYEGGGAHDVTCGAGHSFCFVCRGAAHRCVWGLLGVMTLQHTRHHKHTPQLLAAGRRRAPSMTSGPSAYAMTARTPSGCWPTPSRARRARSPSRRTRAAST